MRTRLHLAVVLSVIALTIASCSGRIATPSPAAAPTPPLLPTISVANGTTVPVAITINGVQVGTVPPGKTEDPISATLPARPWTVEARSPSGRLLATLLRAARPLVRPASARTDVQPGPIEALRLTAQVP
jgi:hypothetical protein